MVDLLSDADRAALRDVALALRGAQMGAERLAARLPTEAEARAAAGRRDTLVGAGSRVLVAVVVAVGLFAVGLFAGLRASKSTPIPAPTLTNVATHSDITSSETCIRSDLAVYLDGAAPNPLCGLPPGAPTKGNP